MIRVENIKKTFGTQEVLKGISVNFEQGKTNLIIGKSGAGKTVLLKLLVGLYPPSDGNIWYLNTNFTALDRKDRKAVRNQMGMLFQGSALFDSMSVYENVCFPLDMFTNFTRKEKEMRVGEVLERVELSQAHAKYPSQISGGMQKRVGIARAIVLKPSFLFCDEPNSGLDPTTSLRIDELIGEITRENNITTVINTHDMNSVMEIGDNIAFLHLGELAWQGSRHEVLTSDNQLLQDFIFASPFLQRLRDAAMANKAFKQ
jgi:phospholipid/cholesterol/gamma-HCH transport system ATP-binding protein